MFNLRLRKMNITKYLCGLALLVMVGCSDGFYGGDINKFSPDTKRHYLYVSSNKVEMDAAEASSSSLKVQAEETLWAFRGMAAWLSVAPTSGSADAAVTLTAKANSSGDNMRTSVFSLESTEPAVNFAYSISATQRTAQPYVNLSATELTFPAAASSQTVQVQSNVRWQMSETAELTWLRVAVAPDSSAITFTVSENATFSGHQVVLNFYDKYWNRLNTLMVTQRVPESPELSSSVLAYDAMGGTYALTLTSQVAWTASSTASWLQVTPQSGEGGTTQLAITALPNMTVTERVCHVSIHVGSRQMAELEVRQKGLYLSVEPAELEFGSNQSTKEVAIHSNAPWTVLNKPEWVTVSATEGTGSGTLALTAEPYWGASSRSGIVKIGITGTSLTATISVKQVARHFDDLSVTLLQFGSLPETQSVDVRTDGVCVATVDEAGASWISLSTNRWKGDKTLEISVRENQSDEERTGYVYLAVDEKTQTITVVQRGKYFTVLPVSMAELPATGGSHQVRIATDDEWTATSTSTWMSLSARQGKGNIELTLTAEANNSIYSRMDTTTFAAACDQSVRVLTHQAGHYLTVDAAALCFFASGQLSDVIHVSSDAPFTLSTDEPSWFSVSRNGNEITVTAEQNNSGKRREGTIVLKMEDLPENEAYLVEIPVIQSTASTGVDVLPFSKDEQWDLGGNEDIQITVTGFSADKDWDEVYSGKFFISVTTYPTDKNWD